MVVSADLRATGQEQQHSSDDNSDTDSLIQSPATCYDVFCVACGSEPCRSSDATRRKQLTLAMVCVDLTLLLSRVFTAPLGAREGTDAPTHTCESPLTPLMSCQCVLARTQPNQR